MTRPVRLTRRGYIVAAVAILAGAIALNTLWGWNRGLVPCDAVSYDTPSTFPAGSAGARAFDAEPGAGIIVCR
jgi:hypothetical protein